MTARDILSDAVTVTTQWQNDGYEFLRDDTTYTSTYTWSEFVEKNIQSKGDLAVHGKT